MSTISSFAQIGWTPQEITRHYRNSKFNKYMEHGGGFKGYWTIEHQKGDYLIRYRFNKDGICEVVEIHCLSQTSANEIFKLLDKDYYCVFESDKTIEQKASEWQKNTTHGAKIAFLCLPDSFTFLHWVRNEDETFRYNKYEIPDVFEEWLDDSITDPRESGLSVPFYEPSHKPIEIPIEGLPAQKSETKQEKSINYIQPENVILEDSNSIEFNNTEILIISIVLLATVGLILTFKKQP